MHLKILSVTSLSLLLSTLPVSAANFSLQGVDQSDMNLVVGDMATNFMHTSVSGASPLGHIFGFEIGVVGGRTNTPHLDDVVHQSDPNSSADSINHANLLGVLTVPLGLTAEIGFLPKVGKDDFRAGTSSLALKWTPTELFLDLPVSLAVKASYTDTKLSFKQTVNGVPISYDYDGKTTELIALVSKSFAILEPYFGLGVVNAKGDLSADSLTVYQNGSYSMSGKRSGSVWLLGTEVNLFVVKLGVEYTKMFDTSRVTGKLSFYF